MPWYFHKKHKRVGFSGWNECQTAKIEMMYERNKLTEVQRAAIAGYHKGNLIDGFDVRM